MNNYLLENIKKNAGLVGQESLINELMENVTIEEEYLSESEMEYLAEGLVFFKKSKRLNRLADVLEKKNEKKNLGGMKRIINSTRKVAVMYQKVEQKNKSKDKVERKEAKAEYKKIGRDFSDILDELKRKEIKTTLKAIGGISVIVAIVLLITSGYLQQLDIFNSGKDDFTKLDKADILSRQKASKAIGMDQKAAELKLAKEKALAKTSRNMSALEGDIFTGEQKSYAFQSDFQHDITALKSKFVFDLNSKTDDVKDVISAKTMKSLEAVNTKVKDPIVKKATETIKYFFHKEFKLK